MISKSSIIAQYADKSHGLHRSSEEPFLKKEADEKLFHLGTGKSLLDFGCGSADLLVYYAKYFDQLVGADISDNMIRKAKSRAEQFHCSNITLEVADDDKIWNLVGNQKYEVITTAGVLQYFSDSQIAGFLESAVNHLSEDGKIVLFDIIDPRIYWLLNCGLFREKPMSLADYCKAIALSSRYVSRRLLDKIGIRADLMGSAHHPHALETHGKRLGMDVSCVRSMYYEYRYHALLTRTIN